MNATPGALLTWPPNDEASYAPPPLLEHPPVYHRGERVGIPGGEAYCIHFHSGLDANLATVALIPSGEHRTFPLDQLAKLD